MLDFDKTILINIMYICRDSWYYNGSSKNDFIKKGVPITITITEDAVSALRSLAL